MASTQRREAEAKQLLSGARVQDLMTPNPISAPAEMTIEEFVRTILSRHPHSLIPILAGERVIGGAGFREIKDTPRDVWASTTLASIAIPLNQIPTVAQSLPIESALEQMQQAHASRLLVTDNERIVGILTLKDLARHVRLRSELSSPRAARA